MFVRKNHYSRLIVLVCNIPDECYATPLEKKIIHGLKTKWMLANNDPQFERLHIIYLHPEDEPSMDKFAPLKKADQHTKIYIVGHCSPGGRVIETDAIYPDPKAPENLIRYNFIYADLAFILLDNIKHQNVVIHRDGSTLDKLQAATKKIKICIVACYAAVDSTTLLGYTIEESFAKCFFAVLYNADAKKILLCDVVAANAAVAPIGTKKSGLLNAFYFLRGYENLASGFHKVYLKSPYKAGMFDFWQFGYGHQPGNRYKLTFAVSGQTTEAHILKRAISPDVLDVPTAKKYFSAQLDEPKSTPLTVKNSK